MVLGIGSFLKIFEENKNQVTMRRKIYKAIVSPMIIGLPNLKALPLFLIGVSFSLFGYGQTFDPSPYCDINDSDCNNGFDPTITNVTVGNNFSNGSGCGTQDGVSYYNNLGPIPLCKGNNVTGSVTISSADYNDHGLSIWIDLNQDGSFSQSEKVYGDELSHSGPSSVHNFSFQIPNSATGGMTRMRIEGAEDNEPPADEPCEASHSFEDGEIEDYNLVILPVTNQPDISVSQILSPKKGKSSYGIENLKVVLSNVSSQTVSKGTTIPFKMETLNLQSPRSFTYTLNSDLSSCEKDTVDLGLMSLGCSGVNELSVWSEWGNDINGENDTASRTYFGTTEPKEFASEDFEGGSIPSGWQSNSPGDFDVTNACASSGSYSLFIDGLENNWIESPEYNVTNYGALEISFNYREAENCGGEDPDGNEGIALQYWDGNTWETATTTDGANDIRTFTNRTVIIDEGLNPDFKIRFFVYGASGGSNDSWRIDDVKIGGINEAKPSTRPSSILSAPDTVYVKSPTEFNTVGNQKSQVWYRDGNKVDSLSKSYSTTFSQIGKDSISVISAGCYGIFQDKGYFEVVNPPKAPIANFIANKNLVDTNGIVNFSDESQIGPTSWEWEVSPQIVDGESSHSFLNGTNSPNPDIRFHKTGTYDITLITGNQKGYDTLTRKAYIEVKEGYRICQSSVSNSVNGILYDPAGTNNFNDDSSQYCQFLINPDCADSITLSVEDLNIEGEACNLGGIKDYIEVYDGTTTNGTPLHTQKGFSPGVYSGNAPAAGEHFTAHSGAMVVAFNTNGCASSEDFKLSWEAHQSASPATKRDVSANNIQAPDTAYIGGFSNFSVSNHNGANKYNFLLPKGLKYVFNGGNGSYDLKIGSRIDEGWQTVQLVTKQCGFADTASAQVYFKEPTQKPLAQFTATQTQFKVGDTIQLLDQSERGVNSWDWDIQPASGIQYVKGDTADARNPYIVATAPGNYRVDLIAGNKVGQTVEAKIDFLNVKEVCEPTVANTNSDFSINNFAVYKPGLGKVYENTSALSSVGYAQYNASSDVKLEAGKEYVFEISRNTAFNNISYGMWLDLDNDGTFSSSELVASSTNDSGYTFKDTVTIPYQEDVGLRNMRVATNLPNSSLNGCGPHSTGEFEDYTIDYIGDATAPMLTLKGNDTLHVNTCANVTDTGATAFDLVAGNLTGEIATPNAEVLNEPGTHELVYQVSDGNGNMSQITQTVMVGPDTSKPQIMLNGGSTVDVHFGGEYEEPGYTAMDTCGDVKEVTVNGQVNTGTVGDYALTYTAIDYNGNVSSVKRTVNVYDSIPPEARLNGRDTIRVNVFSTFDDPGVIASDNYFDSFEVHVTGKVNTDEVGTYNQIYNVIDADSNVTQVERVVIVEDNEAPTFSNLPEEVIKHDVRTKFNFDFDVSDNYYDANTLSVNKRGSFFNNFPKGVPDSVGFFNARFTYEDGSGNTNTATIGVQVVDREAPTITLLGPTVVNIKRWEEYQDSMGVTYKVNDNHYSDDQLTVEMKGSYFNQYIDGGKVTGFFEKRYQVVDPSGNESDVKSRGINVKNNLSGVEDAENLSFNVYPNPTQGEVNVDIQLDQAQNVDIDILNMQGQVVESVVTASSLKEDHYNLDLSDLGVGVYQVRIQTADKVINRSLNIVK